MMNRYFNDWINIHAISQLLLCQHREHFRHLPRKIVAISSTYCLQIDIIPTLKRVCLLKYLHFILVDFNIKFFDFSFPARVVKIRNWKPTFAEIVFGSMRSRFVKASSHPLKNVSDIYNESVGNRVDIYPFVVYTLDLKTFVPDHQDC